MFFVEQRTIPDIATEWGIDPRGKRNSYAVQIINRFLREPHTINETARNIPSAYLRKILPDNPIPEARRVVYAYLTGDSTAIADLDDSYVQWIIDTYTTDMPWGLSWATNNWTLERKLVNLILTQPDPTNGIPILNAAGELGVDYDTLVALTRPTRRPALGWECPALFKRTWRLHELPIDQRHLLLHTCPHLDCPGRGAGSNEPELANKTILASHILHTPETPDGILCPHCRRMPSNPDVRFPHNYLKPWRQKTIKEDGTHKGTRLPSQDTPSPNRAGR